MAVGAIQQMVQAGLRVKRLPLAGADALGAMVGLILHMRVPQPSLFCCEVCAHCTWDC